MKRLSVSMDSGFSSPNGQCNATLLLRNIPCDTLLPADYSQMEKSNIVASGYWKRLSRKFMYEGALAISTLPHLLPKIFLLKMGAAMVFRNIAHMRHVQGPRLKDLGFELIPEHDSNVLSELNPYLISVIFALVALSPLFSSHAHPRDTFAMDTIMKLINMLCVGHILRFCTYISTSLPGPAPHCQPGAENYQDTISWGEVFTRQSTYNGDPNCGDLIFSGHMFQVTSYCAVIFGDMSKLIPHKVLARIVMCIMLVPWCIQPYLIISARNHYTVDVVVSTYLAPLVWFALEGFYRTTCCKNVTIWFSQFVPSYIRNYLRDYKPSLHSLKKVGLDKDVELPSVF